MYAVGDTVQDFTLPNQNGEMITYLNIEVKKYWCGSTQKPAHLDAWRDVLYETTSMI